MSNAAESIQDQADSLEIPAFLDKRNKENNVTHAEHSVPKDTPEIAPLKKVRNKTVLPDALVIDGEDALLEDLSLPELVDYKFAWENKLADMPRLALELKAIHAEIRRKAK